MRYLFFTSMFLVVFVAVVSADSGVIRIKSNHDVPSTLDRLEKVLKEKGMKVFARINHAKGAASVGKQLRPTALIIFGNPKVGSPLMQCQQSVAIDLPQKALIWKDAQGTVWISYNDPRYLQSRHNIPGCNEVISKIGAALAGITKAASGN